MEPIPFPDSLPPGWTAIQPPSRRTAKSGPQSLRSHLGPGSAAGSQRPHRPRYGSEAAPSESGVSVFSAFETPGYTRLQSSKEGDRAKKRARKEEIESPVRALARWVVKGVSGTGGTRSVVIVTATVFGVVIIVKTAVGLGSYSGLGVPPLRGDFEAQRNWIALTSSILPSSKYLHDAASATGQRVHVPVKQWYSYELSYWGLDYPPLTAYHSLLLGFLAKLSPRTAAFTTLRPGAGASVAQLAAWEERMTAMELSGEMRTWMRGTVLGGDAIVWMSAAAMYCWGRFASKSSKDEKGLRTFLVTSLTVLLQPALILIDNGHFQYNSLMLGFTLWAVLCFQSGRDCLGAVFFVCALCFKQMALYYAPAIFAYLLGKCIWLGHPEGLTLFLNLGLTTLGTFALLFSPFLTPLPVLLQSLHRIFPFARGLFEDKVANVWCALNTVVKLRNIASVQTLARLSLAATLLAVLPSVVGVLWVSGSLGSRRRADVAAFDAKAKDRKPSDKAEEQATVPNTIVLLPHALFISSMAFFLLSFQVHEKSILLPLMPLTLLMGGREAGFGRLDWEWGALVNNVGVFSMWPLLKRDGLGLQYVALTLAWNYLIGYNPIRLRASFVKYLSLICYATMLVLHIFEVVADPPRHLPDLFNVLNLTMSAGVFGLSYLWASKRVAQEGWAIVGWTGSDDLAPKSVPPTPTASSRSRARTAEPEEVLSTHSRSHSHRPSDRGDDGSLRRRREKSAPKSEASKGDRKERLKEDYSRYPVPPLPPYSQSHQDGKPRSSNFPELDGPPARIRVSSGVSTSSNRLPPGYASAGAPPTRTRAHSSAPPGADSRSVSSRY